MSTATVTPTDEQQVVLDAVDDWVESDSMEFAVGGLAGTGKTTVAGIAHDNLLGAGRSVGFIAPTGKAAAVLRQKGVTEATTIHSVIYWYDGKIKHPDGTVELLFRKKEELEERAAFFVVDESSMVNARMRQDILSFNCPILWIGDHGQLPPVGDDPRIMSRCDRKLETIHRQAADNPIIKLAYAVRESGEYDMDFHGGAVGIYDSPDPYDIVADAEAEGVNQILCGFRKTRAIINEIYRDYLGYDEPLVEGDRLVCLRNDKSWHVYNGQTFVVNKVYRTGRDSIVCNLTDEAGETRDGITLLRKTLGTGDWDDTDIRGVDRCVFDLGYALTVHKAQGSSWKNVVVIDETANCGHPPAGDIPQSLEPKKD